MSYTDEFGIQSIPPRYDENNSYYIYTSEGYSRAVEEIEAEERNIADTEIIEERKLALDSDEIERLEAANRENEKRFLEEIQQNEEHREIQLTDVAEYELGEEALPGSRIDILG